MFIERTHQELLPDHPVGMRFKVDVQPGEQSHFLHMNPYHLHSIRTFIQTRLRVIVTVSTHDSSQRRFFSILCPSLLHVAFGHSSRHDARCCAHQSSGTCPSTDRFSMLFSRLRASFAAYQSYQLRRYLHLLNLHVLPSPPGPPMWQQLQRRQRSSPHLRLHHRSQHRPWHIHPTTESYLLKIPANHRPSLQLQVVATLSCLDFFLSAAHHLPPSGTTSILTLTSKTDTHIQPVLCN